jgi:hypothetical protein
MRVLLIGLLLLVPVAVPGLAHASPPDPTWIPGIYDDADGDDVVTLIASGSAAAPSATAAASFIPLVVPLPGTREPSPLARWTCAAPPRAPPAR